MDYDFRWARQDEWVVTMDMIWRTFLKFDGPECTEEGIKSFYDFITDVALYQAFLAGNYRLLVALDGDRVIGAGSLRHVNHLSLLFVEEEYHLQGVGRQLMDVLLNYLKNELGEHYVSLYAAPYAVDFYRKLGFTQVKSQTRHEGIPVVSMEKVF